MEKYEVFKSLAIIIVAAKVFGLGARKIKAPQVAGEIVAGLLIGPSVLGLVGYSDFIGKMAEMGVIILMFTAGLETKLSELRKNGIKSLLIAIAGVFIPLICGTFLYFAFNGMAPWGSDDFYKGVAIGMILTATSVSITVETLKELGKLSDTVGTTITSAAIIDDVIGILVLTLFLGTKDATQDFGHTLLKTGLFFVVSIVFGIVIYKVFKFEDKRHPHTRRIPIMGIAMCFALAYAAERYFGVADITGAYVAGVILSSLDDSTYISRKMDINSYMIFGPVFFASIGLQTDVREINPTILLFSLCFVIVGMVSKILGCGAMGRLCGFKGRDAWKIGVGMMTRGEVALIVAQRCLSFELMDGAYFTSVILLIIASSIITPLLLKFLYTEKAKSL